MNKALVVAGGIGVGAGLVYLLDPNRGAQRRARLRDALNDLVNSSRETFSEATSGLRQQVGGIWNNAKARVSRSALPDDVLGQRVREKIGTLVSYPDEIHVSVNNGYVSLSGRVRPEEASRLVSAVSTMAGVHGVDNWLSMLGATYRSGQGTGRSWTPAKRALIGLAGGGLALYGLRRRGPIGRVTGTVGMGLLSRGFGWPRSRFWGRAG